MVPKCSLTGYNPFLQLLGLLFMAVILVIVVIYYLQVYHTRIVEKYTAAAAASGAIDNTTIDYKNEADTGDRSTYPQDKYPGAKMELVGEQSADATETDTTKDIYKLRDCKVYFTDDVGACDNQQDIPTKTCSYKFDGWKEFDTYTDNNGKTLTYPKKKYKPNASNTSELINSHFTSKCFKEFDNNGKGSAKRFEYKENKVVKYDSKGAQDNTEIDTNIFGGKKYTSIQFMNTENAADNLAKVIDSICSLKYNPIRDLTDKVFYKFIFDSNRNITSIQKLGLEADQKAFNVVQEDALTDFASLGSHGLRFDENGKLQIFINSTTINATMNIYKFNYLTNICTDAQIKDYTKYSSKNINISNFVAFEPQNNTKEKTIEINNLNLVEQDKKTLYSVKNEDAYINYNKEILEYVDKKKNDRIDTLKQVSESEKASYRAIIETKQREKAEADTRINNFKTQSNSFANVMNLTRSNGARIFDYQRGYKYTILDAQVIPTITNFKTIYTANETFTIPDGGMVCDILVVGGGGAGVGGGGGAGACVAILGYTLSAGTCTINIGRGGYYSAGGDSTIVINGTTQFKAAGGGAGGNLLSYSDFARNNGGIGGCGGGGYGPRGRGGEVKSYSCLIGGGMVSPGMSYGSWSCRGNSGGNADMGWSNHCGGGGGMGAVGKPYSSYSVAGAPDGGAGINAITIGGRSYNLKDHFAGGQAFGHNNNGYIGGGGGGRLSTDRATDLRGQGGVGGGGKSNAGWWGNMVNAEDGAPNTGGGGGGGGYGSTGGSGIVVIKVVNGATPSSQSSVAATVTPTNVSITHPDTDEYYKHSPWPGYVYIPPKRVQTGIVTSFIYLQKGFYRFKADIGGGGNISYAELVIYDESTLQSNRNYSCKKVFKYINNGIKYVPAYSRNYIEIPTNKFYKLAYTFKYVNDTTSWIYDYFNIYAKFLNNPRNDRGASSVLLTNGDNSDSQFDTYYLSDINVNYASYLFSGDAIYRAYNNTDMIRIFSTISYDNNNDARTNSLNYAALTEYINNGRLDNAPIDYFRLNALTNEINTKQVLLDGAYDKLTGILNSDSTITNYKTLYNDIRNIKFKDELPLKSLTLNRGTPFVSIFGTDNAGENKATDYITYDKVSDTNNLANPVLTQAVYIEALN